MKNNMILMMALMLFIVPVVYSEDFSNMYLQSRSGIYDFYGSHSSATFLESYLLRSTNVDTGLDKSDPTFSYCSYLLGASEFNPVPVVVTSAYYRFNYSSLIIPYANRIVQMTADCTIFDQYNITDGYIVSQMGNIRAWEDGADFYMPQFAVMKFNNVTDRLYAMFFTLNNNTEIVLEQEILVSSNSDKKNRNRIDGFTGGCYSSALSGCPYEDRVFMMAFDNITRSPRNNVRLFTYGNDGNDWSVQANNISIINFALANDAATGNNRMLFFDDWNNDNNNEIIFPYTTGAAQFDNQAVYLSYLNLLDAPPYYTSTTTLSNTFKNTTLPASGTDMVQQFDMMTLSPCQVGSEHSIMELCGWIQTDDASYDKEGLIYDNSLVTSLGYNWRAEYGASHYENMFPVFTVTEGEYPLDRHVCMPAAADEDWMCYSYDESGDDNFYWTFNLSFMHADVIPDNMGQVGSDYLDIFIGEFDGNTSSPDLILSDGKMYSFRFEHGDHFADHEGETINMSYIGDLLPTVGWVQGRIFTHDLNLDGTSELIYFSKDANMTRIYSMDNYPYIPQQFDINNTEEPDDTNDTNEWLNPDVEIDPDSGVPPIFQVLFEPSGMILNTIFGLILPFVVMGAVASFGITSPVILIFAGVVGLVMSFIFGLLGIGALILLIVVLLILLLLAFTIFKGNN